MSTPLTRARWAVAALFFTNGALYANMAPRFPEIKAALGLSDAIYGLSIASFAVGALVAGLSAGALIRRWGAPVVALISTTGTGLAILATAFSPYPLAFAAGMFLAGGMDAITDVAQNDHALQVQQEMGRSIINGFHATWSIGMVSGGAMASAAIALNLPLTTHLLLSAVVFSVIAVIARFNCLPHSRALGADGQDTKPAAIGGLSIARMLILLAITGVTVGSTLVEDLGSSWASLYLQEGLGAPGEIAAFGLVTVTGAQFVGRLLGDRMVDRFGSVNMARFGGGCVVLGLGVALGFPSLITTFIGFALAGFGVATLVPSAFHAADEVPGLSPGTGLTIVAWLMRVTFLVSPPLIGVIADATTLRVSLALIPVMGVLVIVLAPVLSLEQAQKSE